MIILKFSTFERGQANLKFEYFLKLLYIFLIRELVFIACSNSQALILYFTISKYFLGLTGLTVDIFTKTYEKSLKSLIVLR
jgi:hypothetical protein